MENDAPKQKWLSERLTNSYLVGTIFFLSAGGFIFLIDNNRDLSGLIVAATVGLFFGCLSYSYKWPRRAVYWICFVASLWP
jgi:hypothetical protein